MQCTSTDRMIAAPETSGIDGHVERSPAKSLWIGGMVLAALALGPWFVTPAAAWLTFGEAWHSTHHAWPQSARLGAEEGQADPAWWLLLGL